MTHIGAKTAVIPPQASDILAWLLATAAVIALHTAIIIIASTRFTAKHQRSQQQTTRRERNTIQREPRPPALMLSPFEQKLKQLEKTLDEIKQNLMSGKTETRSGERREEDRTEPEAHEKKIEEEQQSIRAEEDEKPEPVYFRDILDVAEQLRDEIRKMASRVSASR